MYSTAFSKGLHRGLEPSGFGKTVVSAGWRSQAFNQWAPELDMIIRNSDERIGGVMQVQPDRPDDVFFVIDPNRMR